MSFYDVIFKIFCRPITALYRLKVEGAENLPPKDPSTRGYIICANHTSFSDVFAISGALEQRRLRYMAKAELFAIPLFGTFLKALGAYPVKRGGTDIKSVKKTLALLEEGEIVGIFPQGTRQPFIPLKEANVKNGVGMFAYRSGCDVVPAYIETKARQTRILRKTKITFGDVIKNSEFNFTSGGNDEYKAAAELIFARIVALEEKDRNPGN